MAVSARARLGTHTTSVVISDLSGAVVPGHPTPRQITACTWSRVLSDTSTAKIEITAPTPALRAAVCPWVSVVTITRAGVPVWYGIVYVVTMDADTLTLDCRDTSALAAKRVLTTGMSWAGQDSAQIARDMIRTAMADDPYRVLSAMIVSETGRSRFLSLEIPGGTKTLSELLRQLAQDAEMVWTVTAGRWVVGAAYRDVVIGPIGPGDITSDVSVTVSGPDAVTAATVRGKGVAGYHADSRAPIRLDAIHTADSLTIAAACDDEAARLVTGGWPPPLVVSGDSLELLPGAACSIGDLVPGVVVELRLAWLPGGRAAMRLEKIDVDATKDQVKIGLGPLPVYPAGYGVDYTVDGSVSAGMDERSDAGGVPQ